MEKDVGRGITAQVVSLIRVGVAVVDVRFDLPRGGCPISSRSAVRVTGGVIIMYIYPQI